MMRQKMPGQGHSKPDLIPISRLLAPKKIRQRQELIMIGQTRSPGYRAPGAGRDISEVGREPGDRAALEFETEAKCGEQIALPTDITCRPVGRRIESFDEALKQSENIRVRLAFW